MAASEVTSHVVNNGNTDAGDDIYCSCNPSTTAAAATPSKSLNNNNKGLSPYLVSVATSPRKKHTKTVMTSTGGHETTKTLPPLDINRTILYHHSTRRSARKSSRGHTVPVMLATKASIANNAGGTIAAGKRSHSAASTAEDQAQAAPPGTPESSHQGRRSSRGQHHHHRLHTSSSPERKSSKVLCTPEKMLRRGHILNKIETVRILRARPAFYPIKDSGSSKAAFVSSNKSSAKSVRELMDGASTSSSAAYHEYMHHQELPNNILGKHITLRMDRSELKRKRGKVPSTHLA